MILIADSGSTKTDWCLIKNKQTLIPFETEGYHPFFVDSEYIYQSLKQHLPQEIQSDAGNVSEIFFYSAGGSYSLETDNILITGLNKIFFQTNIIIETDLLAAARALLGSHAGFAAILGTGTNTCIYDGKKVVNNIESLGFILGDEGSGSYIGKKLIGDYIRGYMPLNMSNKFEDFAKMNTAELINRIYTQPMANKFCAHFSTFAGQNISDSYCHALVYNCFTDLFNNIISKYPHFSTYEFNCVGTVAFHFRKILAGVITENNMQMGKIIQYPMEGLVQYHLNKFFI